MSIRAALPRLWQQDSPWLRLLLPLAWAYEVLVRTRRALYSAGVLRAQRVAVPVVVVGNRVVGGAGKTPVVLALVEGLRQRGWRPGVVSRGYGRSARGCVAVGPQSSAYDVGDEPLLIYRRGRVPVWVAEDRVAAARGLLAAHPDTDLIVADDGLQHLRLARDVDVIVYDERGAGNGTLLPAGPLREPVDTPSQGTAIILYNAPAASTAQHGYLAHRDLRGAVALEAWWHGLPAQPEHLAALQPHLVLAVAGIARPERFFAALRYAGLTIQEIALPDHFDYQVMPWPPQARHVVTTEKDAVKLDVVRLKQTHPQTQIWVVPLELTAEPAFFIAVAQALGSPPAAPAEVPMRREPSAGPGETKLG